MKQVALTFTLLLGTFARADPPVCAPIEVTDVPRRYAAGPCFTADAWVYSHDAVVNTAARTLLAEQQRDQYRERLEGHPSAVTVGLVAGGVGAVLGVVLGVLLARK